MTTGTFGTKAASRKKPAARASIATLSGVSIGSPSAIIDSSVPPQDSPKLLRQTEEFRERGQTQSISGTGFGARPHPLLGQSVEDVDRLLETFQNRRKFILGRKRAPGRAPLLLVNR